MARVVVIRQRTQTSPVFFADEAHPQERPAAFISQPPSSRPYLERCRTAAPLLFSKKFNRKAKERVEIGKFMLQNARFEFLSQNASGSLVSVTAAHTAGQQTALAAVPVSRCGWIRKQGSQEWGSGTREF
jgi:hypothetical protein